MSKLKTFLLIYTCFFFGLCFGLSLLSLLKGDLEISAAQFILSAYYPLCYRYWEYKIFRREE